jgi:hypothetical protein
MFALGFFLDSPLDGMECNFIRPAEGSTAKMSVTFHRSHGRAVAVYSNVMLAHYRHVLTRRFGWEEDDFVEDEAVTKR